VLFQGVAVASQGLSVSQTLPMVVQVVAAGMKKLYRLLLEHTRLPLVAVVRQQVPLAVRRG